MATSTLLRQLAPLCAAGFRCWPGLFLLAFLLLAARPGQAQGFNTTATPWALPAGGYATTSHDYSYYKLANTAAAGSTSALDHTWATLDLNGDAKPDLVVLTEGNGSYNEPFGTGAGRYWKVFLNTGTGFATTATTWTLPEGGGIDLGTGRRYSFNWLSGEGSKLIGNQTWDIWDLTGDGRPELLILREGTGVYDDVFGTGTARYWKVYQNTGTGYATTATNWGLPAGGLLLNSHSYSFAALAYGVGNAAVGSQSWATLDLNGDAKIDLVVLTEQNATYNEPFGTGANRYWKAYLNSASPLATRPAIGAGSVEVYPNPAKQAFTLRLPALGSERTAQLTLFNTLGQAVQTRSLELRPSGTEARVDISALAVGLYTVRVQAGSQMAAQHVVVE